MNKERGELFKNKLRYAGIRLSEAYEKLGENQSVINLMMKGQVLCSRIDDKLSMIIVENFLKKRERELKKKEERKK